MASAVGGCGISLPLTLTVGVPVTLALVAASVTLVVQARYFTSLTHWANVLSVMPDLATISSLVRPLLFSSGWLAYIAVTNSRVLPASEAQPEAADERVEYSLPLEARSRNETGWYTIFALPSSTSLLTASPWVFSKLPQIGHMKS